MMVFLKEFFENVDFEKIQQTTKKHAKLPSMQRINNVADERYFSQVKCTFRCSMIPVTPDKNVMLGSNHLATCIHYAY